MCVCVCVCACTRTCVYVCVFVCVGGCAYMHACGHVWVFLPRFEGVGYVCMGAVYFLGYTIFYILDALATELVDNLYGCPL